MILIFTSSVLLFLYVLYNFENDLIYKYFYLSFVVGFSIYSGIGIITEHTYIEDNALLYIIQFILFMLLFIIGSIIVRKIKFKNFTLDLDNILNPKFILFMASIYIITYVYRCIFSGVSIYDFVNIKDLFINYKSTAFSIRVNRRNNSLFNFITNQVASLTMPFFFIHLYNIRKKHLKFIVIYLIPVILRLLADGYLSRNRIAVHILFLLIFIIKEELISKKNSKRLLLVSLPILLIIFANLEFVRSGAVMGYSNFSMVSKMLASEFGYPKYYDYCNKMSSDYNTINYLIYILIVWIPSNVYKYIGIEVPNLAYEFTEKITGLAYGQSNNYYILLPSVLGEAIILFGNKLACVYGFIYGVFSTTFLKILKSHKILYYYMVYFMLDFFRQFRGGSQYVITFWESQLVPFIIIVAILRLSKNIK